MQPTLALSNAPRTAASATAPSHAVMDASTTPNANASANANANSAALARRAAQGDRGALEALLRENARVIYDLCFHVAGASDARDAAQEALERVVTAVASFDPERGAFRTWALTVARNVCRDRLRRRGLERVLFHDDGDERAERAHSSMPDPERAAMARADARRLAAAMENLNPNVRAALVLFHVHEARYEEIAEALDVPMGTVMTWLHRGRKRLREELEKGDAGR